jgi:aspartate racemase
MEASTNRRTIGVLGGMGPAATVDFYGKLVAGTPADRDQDHLPVIIDAVPQIPDRSTAFLAGGVSPRDMLVQAASRLAASGADMIVMPCNTAHLWHDEVAAAVAVPVMHIVDPVLQALDARRGEREGVKAGLLATSATVQGGVYQLRGGPAKTHVEWLLPSDEQQRRWVDEGIRAVKAGKMAAGRRLLSLAARTLVTQGARVVVLACTEVPLVLGKSTDGVEHLDSTQLLADATIDWALRSGDGQHCCVVRQ